MNCSVLIDMPELDSEILEQIETAGEAASPDNSFIYLMAFLCVCFFIVSYLLYFKPEWVYKITQSWKSYTLNECTDEYKFFCKISAVIALLFAIDFCISAITGNLPFIAGLFT